MHRIIARRAIVTPGSLRSSASHRTLSTATSRTSPFHSRTVLLSTLVVLGTSIELCRRSEILSNESATSWIPGGGGGGGGGKKAPKNKGYESQSQLHGGKEGSITPGVFLWGRNTHNVAAPNTPDSEVIKKPKFVKALDGAVLRDLVLGETYAVAVTASGDILQWGSGFSPSPSVTEPEATLVNRDILRVALSPHKIYALSRKGEIWVFPANKEAQAVRGGSGSGQGGASWWNLGGLLGGGKDAGIDCVRLGTGIKLERGEKFISISTGTSHLLALTSHHRSFSLPLSSSANSAGQLSNPSFPLFTLPSPSPSQFTKSRLGAFVPDPFVNEMRRDYAPPTKLDPLLTPSGRGRIGELDARAVALMRLDQIEAEQKEKGLVGMKEQAEREESEERKRLDAEKEIRFCTTLLEIPALKGVRIGEMVAGDEHSVARTVEGRVLGWGANGYGQLGLGASLAYPSIPTPTEIPLARCYPKATRMTCERIAAGGNLTYFVVQKEDIGNGKRGIDLLATGNGQMGGIGNGTWAHAPEPVKVKTISGLLEWKEKSREIEPIAIKEIAVGKNHIAIVLDNAVEQPGGIKFGRDVFVWGQNEFYQLGTGKRSSLSTPQHLPPLPYPGLTGPLIPDQSPQSGTLSPMPHSRLQLAPEIKVGGRWVEETIVAGDHSSAVYWRILDP